MASLADFTGNGRSDRSPKTVFLAGPQERGRGARLEDALHDYIGLANALEATHPVQTPAGRFWRNRGSPWPVDDGGKY